MIKFEQKVNPEIYDLVTRDLDLDFTEVGGEKCTIKVLSMSSHKAKDAIRDFNRRIKWLAEQEDDGASILLTKEEVDIGIPLGAGETYEEHVPSEWAREHNALLSMALVEDYPEGRDIKADFMENMELCRYIADIAVEIQAEFIAKKKK